MEYIDIKGAREHNLKNVDIKIPKNKLTVITGLSGSGKSSLAFDTIYAEGQRRYVESLSAYARQFLDLMNKKQLRTIHAPLSEQLPKSTTICGFCGQEPELLILRQQDCPLNRKRFRK